VNHYWKDNDADKDAIWHIRGHLPLSVSEPTVPTSEPGISPSTIDRSISLAEGDIIPGGGISVVSDDKTEVTTLYPTPNTPIGVALIQSNLGSRLGNFEAIVHLRSPSGDEHYLAQFYFDTDTLHWSGPFNILVDGKHITGVTDF
jgi:hypothetical protein